MKNKKIISIMSVAALLLGTSFFLAGCGNNNQTPAQNNGFLPGNSEQDDVSDNASDTSGDIVIDQNTASTPEASSTASNNSNTELDLDKEIKDMDATVNSDTASDLNDTNLSNSQLGI